MLPRDLDSTASMQRDLPAARPASGAVLHVVHPSPLATSTRFTTDCVVGRAGDLALDHPTVSRQHARVDWDALRGAHVVRDLGSRNGSACDGDALSGEPRLLVDQSVLRFGEVLVVYERAEPGDDDAPEVSREAAPGDSLAMGRLRRALGRAAPDNAPALLLGDTGTGKERLAAELHRLSGRRGPFVPVNCAALSAQLAESELFGHVRGAFTGATDAHVGFFRAAEGGTLFLDEVGELPPTLQPKLLRALQEREVQPVGGARALRVDVRVVSATHRDLAALDASIFRRDLYARLALWELRVPPLHRRRADILPWLQRLQFAWERGRAVPPLALSPTAAEAIVRAHWPLNLRGLERLLRELVTAERGARPVALHELPAWVHATPSTESPDAPHGDGRPPVPTREEFTAAFHRLGGSVHALARHYGRDRRQIYRWVEAFGLSDARG